MAVLGGVLLSLTVLVTVCAALLRPAVETATASAQCVACQQNLLRIGAAIEQYREVHGTYPPTVSYDEQGRPLHSWRALILPYLGSESQDISAQLDMRKPWNSQENLSLMSALPDVYRCPADEHAMLGETSYLAIVGANTVINQTALPSDAITDPLAETIVVIEASQSQTNWLNPNDVGIDQLRIGLNRDVRATPGSLHPEGVNALLADGSVVTLRTTTSPQTLRKAATINGNEAVVFE